MNFLPLKSAAEPVLIADPGAPEWEAATKVHDWRNYVGERTRRIWYDLPIEAQLAIARDAQDQANAEDWS